MKFSRFQLRPYGVQSGLPVTALRQQADLLQDIFAGSVSRGTELAMSADHPIIWWRCSGSWRSPYLGLGQAPESFVEPEYITLLQDAQRRSMKLEGEACGTVLVVPEARLESAE